jgi:hypothetical protein
MCLSIPLIANDLFSVASHFGDHNYTLLSTTVLSICTVVNHEFPAISIIQELHNLSCLPVGPTSSPAMAFLSKIVVLFSFFSAVYTAPVILPRAAGSCALWGVVHVTPYELQSNLWGANGASSGNQCTVSIMSLI